MKRTTKIFVAWNIVMGALLLVSLAANANFAQAAADPPIKVFTLTEEKVGAGGGTGGAVTLDSTSYKTLASVSGDLGDKSHICVATAAGDVIRYGTGTGYSTYNLQMDSNAASAGSAMNIGFFSGDPDAAAKAVATTYAFSGVSGAHTFKFIGAKSAAGATNVSVNNSSMTVVCVKKPL